MAQLQSVSCHMGSHSVTCYPTQANTPRLNPSHAGRYSVYLPRTDGRLSWPSWLDSALAGSWTWDLSITSPTLNQCNHQDKIHEQRPSDDGNWPYTPTSGLRYCWCVRRSPDARTERNGWLSRGCSQPGSARHKQPTHHSIRGFLGECGAGSREPGCWHHGAGQAPWRTGPFPTPHCWRPTVVGHDDLGHTLAWPERQRSRLWPLSGLDLQVLWAARAGRRSNHRE